jgi:hypothetical protein
MTGYEYCDMSGFLSLDIHRAKPSSLACTWQCDATQFLGIVDNLSGKRPVGNKDAERMPDLIPHIVTIKMELFQNPTYFRI